MKRHQQSLIPIYPEKLISIRKLNKYRKKKTFVFNAKAKEIHDLLVKRVIFVDKNTAGAYCEHDQSQGTRKKIYLEHYKNIILMNYCVNI